MGDPAGVGPEVIAAGYPFDEPSVAVGDAGVLREAVRVVGADLNVRAVDAFRAGGETLHVVEPDGGTVGDLQRGVVRAGYGRASLAYVERALAACRSGAAAAMATAPLNKQATRAAGAEHPGHTGLLADRTETERYAMLLVTDDLRVSHVSTHVPLREACELVTTDRVFDTVAVTAAGLADLGVRGPRVAVAGLNPHAGDGGVIGSADAEVVAPAVERARESGVDAVGPASPDAVFAAAARGEYDCVVAMYHDQGHIPTKLDGGHRGVNVTLGLPVVRTSVDHGTAFDIAGEGVADPESLRRAVALAGQMARNRASG
jgi:4-hydroxythreonine-4-phosphate dehydrogenase